MQAKKVNNKGTLYCMFMMRSFSGKTVFGKYLIFNACFFLWIQA